MAFAQVNNLIYGATVAAEDLSEKRWFAGVIDSNGEIAVATTAGGRIDGVILDNSPAGVSTSLCLQGVERVVAGGTVAIGDALAVDSSGNFVAAATNDVVVGKALAAGADGEVITAIVYGAASYNEA